VHKFKRFTWDLLGVTEIIKLIRKHTAFDLMKFII